MGVVRVATLNLNYREDARGPWPERKKRIAAALRASNADVVALQAVERREGEADQAAELSAALPRLPHAHFEPSERSADGRRRGSAFLSRIPLESIAIVKLTPVRQTEDRSPRAVLAGRFRVNGATLEIFNAHLSWVPSQRERNVAELLSEARSGDGAAVLAGDFNMTPDTETANALRAAGWTDLWSALRPRDPGFTFDAAHPDRRIDYMWVRPDAVRRGRSIALVGADAPAPLSDHLGLAASLSL